MSEDNKQYTHDREEPSTEAPTNRGRPNKYNQDFNEQAYKLCLLGSTDADLADFFNVCEATINNWKIDFPEFLESIKKGKEVADAKVADALYNRALGFKSKEVKIATADGAITDVQEVDKYYPPDTTAAIFWLKNRQSSKWRDKQVTEHEGKIEVENHNIDYSSLTPEEARQLYLDKLNQEKQ